MQHKLTDTVCLEESSLPLSTFSGLVSTHPFGLRVDATSSEKLSPTP